MDLDQNGPIPTRGFDYVVCPDCGSEFQPRITHCIDCGAATVPPGTVREPDPDQDRDQPGDGPPDEEDEGDEIAIRTEEPEWIEELGELFERHGIASRIEVLPSPSRDHPKCRILVARPDALRASELDLELLRERLGDEGADLVEIPPGICPSCGTRLLAGAAECPGCGLAVAPGNLEIVKDLYEAFRTQDRGQILAIFDPGIEWIQNEGFPGGGRYTGAETVLNEVFAGLAAEWETWRADVGRWLDAGDSIVALGAYQGTHRKTGKSMTAAFAHVYWLRDGRVVRFEQYADTAKVVEACAND